MHLTEQISSKNQSKIQSWHPILVESVQIGKSRGIDHGVPIHHTEELSISTVFVTFIYHAATTHPVSLVRGEVLQHMVGQRGWPFNTWWKVQKTTMTKDDWCIFVIIMPMCKSYGILKGCEKAERILKSFQIGFRWFPKVPSQTRRFRVDPPFRKPIKNYSKNAQVIHLIQRLIY